ncbi:MAG: sigma-70 family RNA polymerase sigma factor [Gemmatimonas sp.]
MRRNDECCGGRHAGTLETREIRLILVSSPGNRSTTNRSLPLSDSPAPDFSTVQLRGIATDKATLDALLPVVYEELHRIAERFLRAERADHTLQPTALVNEAYLRLSSQHSINWINRAQFFGVAAQMMRRILVTHAESRNAAKREGMATRVTLDESLSWTGGRELDLVALDDALNALAKFDPRQAQVVEQRFFAGLSIEETAEVLDISPATVKREWTLAKAWLRRALTVGDE